MFKNPFSFDGRIRRTEYGLSCLLYGLFASILNLMIIAGGTDTIIFGIFYLPMLWFLWAQGAKRCHDVGSSGWWQLIPFYALWMLFQDGQHGLNEYGQNPKGIQLIGSTNLQNRQNIPEANI